MAYVQSQTGKTIAAELRKKAGAYLKRLRNEAGLTQNDFAKALGFQYYTMISQIEAGRARMPPDKMMKCAELLNIPPQEFGKTLLEYHDPFMWELLFGNDKPEN